MRFLSCLPQPEASRIAPTRQAVIRTRPYSIHAGAATLTIQALLATCLRLPDCAVRVALRCLRLVYNHRETMKRLICLLLISTLALQAQGKKKAQRKAQDNPEGPQLVDLGQAKLGDDIFGERISEPEKQSDWPAVAAAADGSLYAIYVVWNDRDADRVVVRR